MPDTVVTAFAANSSWSCVSDIPESAVPRKWWALDRHGEEILGILKRVDERFEAEMVARAEEKKHETERRAAEVKAQKAVEAARSKALREAERERKGLTCRDRMSTLDTITVRNER